MKTLKTFLLCMLTVCLLMSYAFADVAVGPMYAVIFGVPVLAFAIIIIVIVMIVRMLLKARVQREEREKIERHGSEHAQRDSAGKACDWTDKDPWDIKRD